MSEHFRTCWDIIKTDITSSWQASHKPIMKLKNQQLQISVIRFRDHCNTALLLSSGLIDRVFYFFAISVQEPLDRKEARCKKTALSNIILLA
jgi:hypothetical protein